MRGGCAVSELWGIVARAPSGSTAAMELVSGRDAAATRVAELLESDHVVMLYECKRVDYEITTSITIHVVKK